jgi:hypothetical protein
MADLLLTLTGPVQCDKLATIALQRASGEVAELREPVGGCKTLPAPPAKCANGKDDDGDGMIDSRDAAGTTDPDPGCSDPGDKSEDSEVPSPATCDIELAVFNGDVRFPGLVLDGCGVIKGVWFKPPGTPSDCFVQVGSGEVQQCGVKAGTAGATFAPTNMGLKLATHVAADPVCMPVTVALTREDGSVMADRVRWC